MTGSQLNERVSLGAQRSKGIDALSIWVFVVAVIVYLATLLIVGRLPFIDEVVYKAPGREFAATGHFSSPECAGYLDFNPPIEKLFAAYPPLYPFIFGLFLKVVGFSWRSSLLYDGLIHMILCCIAVWVTRRLSPAAPRWRAILVGLACMPLGWPGRPDELGMCFGMLSCILALPEKMEWRRALASGALLGLCCATSIGVAIAFTCMWAMLRLPTLIGNARSAILQIAYSSIAGMAVLVLCVLPIVIQYPHAYAGLMRFAEQTVAGRSLHEAWLQAFQLERFFCLEVIGVFGVSILLLAMIGIENLKSIPARVMHGGLLSIVVMFFMEPGKYPYIWFAVPWLMAGTMAMCGSGSLKIPVSVRRVVTAVFVVGAIIGSVPYLFANLRLFSLPKEQSLSYNTEHLRSLIPPGACVMGDIAWMELGNRNLVLEPQFSPPMLIQKADYVVLEGNGSGKPGVRFTLTPPEREDYLVQNFTVLENDLPPKPFTIFGRQIGHSSFGFGSVIYVRNREPAIHPTTRSN